jgi:probable rRNA maturation factor
MKRRVTPRGEFGKSTATGRRTRTLPHRPVGKGGKARGEDAPPPPAKSLLLNNRQRTRKINQRLLREVSLGLLDDHLQLKAYKLGITLIAETEMTRLNSTFLQHRGSTDVITFDYADVPDLSTNICGEIFACVDEAVLQARRFCTTWQSEIVRYIIHGTLHLLGHDDHVASYRRKMKREENRLLRLLATRFPLSRLAPKPRLRR